MHTICHNYVAIYNLSVHQLSFGWLVKLPAILDSL